LWFKEKPIFIKDIDEIGGEVRFLAKTVATNIRDVNETINIEKRGGKMITDGCVKFLDLKMSDDTDNILCRINREHFEEFGRQICEQDKIGNYYLVHGYCCKGFRYIIIDLIKKILPEEIVEKINKK
jgi:hypothetical protein